MVVFGSHESCDRVHTDSAVHAAAVHDAAPADTGEDDSVALPADGADADAEHPGAGAPAHFHLKSFAKVCASARSFAAKLRISSALPLFYRIEGAVPPRASRFAATRALRFAGATSVPIQRFVLLQV
jgi:hypothetical protein